MNYIFLDIDGVLNNQNDIIRKHKCNAPHFEAHFCEEAYKTLGKICKKCNAKVVLSSTWRLGFRNNMQPKEEDIFSQRLLKLFNKYNIDLIGITTLEYLDRGVQIKKFIKDHLLYHDNYIVIDDEVKNILPYIVKDRVLKIDFKKGLLHKHIRTCKKMFKKQAKIK